MSFRVCDIWRGYWVQRLLWDVNGSLAFTKPTVEQIRNAHNYLDDFKDELQLYTDTPRFIDFLANWTSASADLETRIVELMKAMAGEKFIGEADVDLAQRWIKDLQIVGYKFPRVAAYNSEQVQQSIQVVHKPIQRTVDARIRSNEALSSCQAGLDPSTAKVQVMEDIPFEAFKDVLLVVNFNKGGFYDKVIEPFLDIYKPYFPNIVFYGYNEPPVPAEFEGIVKGLDTQWGELGYMSLVDAMETHPGYKGYLHTNDDVILNVHQLANYDKDKVWKSIPRQILDIHDRTKDWPDDWWIWGWEAQEGVWSDKALFKPEQRERIANFTGVPGPADVRAWADAFYVPGRLVPEFVPLMCKMKEHRVHLELAVGVVLLAIEPTTNWVPWKEEYLWDNWGPKDHIRSKWQNFLRPGLGMLHSVKLSTGKSATEAIKKWIHSVEAI